MTEKHSGNCHKATVSPGYTCDSFKSKTGTDAENNHELYHTLTWGKGDATKEPCKEVKKVDYAHSVVDLDCEGEVTVRYSLHPPGSDLKDKNCAAPNETMKDVAKNVPKILCVTDTNSADV